MNRLLLAVPGHSAPDSRRICGRFEVIVATGNITNDALLSLFELHLDAIVSGFEEADFVELSQNALALGGRTARDHT